VGRVSFPVQIEGVPPLTCPEVPPHPIKARYPLRPHHGVGLAQTPTPHSYAMGGRTPPWSDKRMDRNVITHNRSELAKSSFVRIRTRKFPELKSRNQKSMQSGTIFTNIHLSGIEGPWIIICTLPTCPSCNLTLIPWGWNEVVVRTSFTMPLTTFPLRWSAFVTISTLIPGKIADRCFASFFEVIGWTMNRNIARFTIPGRSHRQLQ